MSPHNPDSESAIKITIERRSNESSFAALQRTGQEAQAQAIADRDRKRSSEILANQQLSPKAGAFAAANKKQIEAMSAAYRRRKQQ